MSPHHLKRNKINICNTSCVLTCENFIPYLIYCILNEFFNKQTKNVDFGLVLLHQLIEFLDYLIISHLFLPYGVT
jgi:hypothetical protein